MPAEFLGTTIDNLTSDERLELSTKLVGHVLDKMVRAHKITAFKPFDPSTAMPEDTIFMPAFLVDFLYRRFRLYIATDSEEAYDMKGEVKRDNIVICIFDGNRVKSPVDIIWSLQYKLIHARNYRSKIKK